LIFRYIQYCLEWRKARIEDNRRWSVTGIHPARSSAGRRVGRSRWCTSIASIALEGLVS
jgi:hypothetical protein